MSVAFYLFGIYVLKKQEDSSGEEKTKQVRRVGRVVHDNCNYININEDFVIMQSA